MLYSLLLPIMRTQFLGSSVCALVSLLGFTAAAAVPVENYSFLDEKPGGLFSTSSTPNKGSCPSGALSTGNPTGKYKTVSGSKFTTLIRFRIGRSF